MPTAIPTGVVSAKASAMKSFLETDTCELSGVERSEESAAMRVPSAMPSKSWWKRMTTKRVRKKESPETTRVRPMTVSLG